MIPVIFQAHGKLLNFEWAEEIFVSVFASRLANVVCKESKSEGEGK